MKLWPELDFIITAHRIIIIIIIIIIMVFDVF